MPPVLDLVCSPRRVLAQSLAWLALAGCVGTSGTPAGPADVEGDDIDPAHGSGGPDGDPGRVTLHRLNRVEYNNTVHDLLGTAQTPADAFPADDRGYGYDNIADVLSLSPLQLELYFNAAGSLVEEVMATTEIAGPQHEVLQAASGQATVGRALDGGAWLLDDSPGSLAVSTTVATAGEYTLKVVCWGEQAGPDLPRMTVSLNGTSLESLDVAGTQASPSIYETTVTLEAGAQQLSASFDNDYNMNGQDRNLAIKSFELEGPLGGTDPGESGNPLRTRIMVCEPDPAEPMTCLREVAKSFGRRAFRRPIEDSEVDKLLAIAQSALDAGDELEVATRTMLQAVLVSPRFVFRIEEEAEPGKVRKLDDYEVASRLSYFLWSSMPDDALLDAAERGELGDETKLRGQVQRLLASDKAASLVENFGGQWLFTRALYDHTPDPNFYPDFDESLREAARRETEAYFQVFLSGEESMEHLLSANFGFVNGRLAEHYGISGASGDELVRVPLPETRLGLMTQATLLTVTSYPHRTSPVKRGKWILEQLLCTPPPAMPNNMDIPPLEDSEMEGLTVRETLEEHRKNPKCASCHKYMDPLGFGLDSYDAIGTFRETEKGLPVDDTGVLPDGTEFKGAREMAALIESDPRFPHCVTRHVLTYALGRGLAGHDVADVDALTAQFVASGQHVPDLIESIVLSAPFRQRRAEEQKP